ncbi:MAG TPA: VacB/RNase II family 3'-5' exoribonuclease [Gaiellaceae bacterium]|nr:VacB/RNase II family 3'-5' exoribonuclease [Gaiellaceae bacterium]
MPGVPIQIDRKTVARANAGDLAVLAVSRGRARLETVLGAAKDIDAVLEGLLVERGLRRPHPHVSARPASDPWPRHDLTGLLAFTIDPETAKDFDDAISVRREDDGLRAWVHIADVSHFVGAGSPLDLAAADRAFSYYVPGRVAPMLPHELADDLCSLRPHVDRHCVTVEIPFDGSLTPGAPRFYRSLIRSDARLTYGQVERILQGRERAEPALAEALRHCDRLTAELRRRRFARGALQVSSPEVTFALDGNGGISDAWRESEPHAHALVEELMILANECVAQLLTRKRREALYRVHERPDPQAIELLLARLDDLDVPTPPAPDPERMGPSEAAAVAAATAERVASYVGRAKRGKEAFPSLVLRALKRARYDPANLGHSGLASPAYCHFTSPIRRYPDLVVHRALLRELGAGDDALPDDLPGLAGHCSVREREASDVEYAADALCLAWLLEDRLFELGWEATFPGEIIGLIESGLFVRFGEVFEGYVPARRLEGDFFEWNPLATALRGRRSGRVYRLGDPLEVRVVEIRRNEGKVELAPAAA